METYEKFNKLIELIGKDKVLEEVLNYFSSDDIDEFVDSVANDHDVMIDEFADTVDNDDIIDEESYLEQILDTTEQWFIDCTCEDFYFDHETRMKDLDAMANHSNDIMVDNCIEYLTDMFSKADDYREEIENKLAELASNEI